MSMFEWRESERVEMSRRTRHSGQKAITLFALGKGMQKTEDADGKGAKRSDNEEEDRERHHQTEYG